LNDVQNDISKGILKDLRMNDKNKKEIDATTINKSDHKDPNINLESNCDSAINSNMNSSD